MVIFPGDTWINIVHDSEGSLIMDHGFVMELYYSISQTLILYSHGTYFLEIKHIVFLKYYSYWINRCLLYLFSFYI